MSTCSGLERRDDVDRLGVGLGDHLAVVLAETVERVAALHGDAGRRDVGELERVVLRGLDRLGEVEADLLAVDVERCDELDVADVVLAELHVHEARHEVGRVGVLVVLDALDERRGAVADADDCYAYRTHYCSLMLVEPVDVVGVVVGVALVRDELVEPADLALGSVESVLLELEGVGVDPLAAAGERLAQGLDPLLEARPAALEDPQANPRLGAAEEGQVGGEALVLPGLRAGLVRPGGELLLAVGGDGVDDAGAAGGQRRGRCDSVAAVTSTSSIRPLACTRRRHGYSEP